jgi:hypothetical protein
MGLGDDGIIAVNQSAEPLISRLLYSRFDINSRVQPTASLYVYSAIS